jgi:hypothetical protein
MSAGDKTTGLTAGHNWAERAAETRVLADEAFVLPKQRKPGQDLHACLQELYADYKGRTGRLDGEVGQRVKARTARIDAMIARLLEAVAIWRPEDKKRAQLALGEAVEMVGGEIDAIAAANYENMFKGQSLYRFRERSERDSEQQVKERRFLFHRPFGIPTKPLADRYAADAAPALYLGNSVLLCHLECNFDEPRARTYASRFQIDFAGWDCKLLDLSFGQSQIVGCLETAGTLQETLGVNASSLLAVFGADPEAYLTDYLTIWPLIAATSLQVIDSERRVEYIIPNLLMDWICAGGRYDGVRFFTTKCDPPLGTHDYSINIALVCRKPNRRGYCEVLRENVWCTQPIAVAAFAAGKQRAAHIRNDIPRDVREAMFDVRERRRGRYWMKQGQRLQHYIDTWFCDVEYELDPIKIGEIET